MDTSEYYQQYEQLWGQEPEDFIKFKNRICTIIARNGFIWDRISTYYAEFYGCRHADVYYIRNLIEYIESRHVGSVEDMVKILQAYLFSLSKRTKNNTYDENLKLYREVLGTIDDCIKISKQPLCVIEKERNIHYIAPSGALYIEKEIVLPAMYWLRDYPKVYTEFTNVLGMYKDIYVNPDNARLIIDGLRVCMELLLKEILKNSKTIENQKEALGEWLKEREIDSITRGLFSHIIRFEYNEYANTYGKHDKKGKYFNQELEFRIYMTSTLIRFLSTL